MRKKLASGFMALMMVVTLFSGLGLTVLADGYNGAPPVAITMPNGTVLTQHPAEMTSEPIIQMDVVEPARHSTMTFIHQETGEEFYLPLDELTENGDTYLLSGVLYSSWNSAPANGTYVLNHYNLMYDDDACYRQQGDEDWIDFSFTVAMDVPVSQFEVISIEFDQNEYKMLEKMEVEVVLASSEGVDVVDAYLHLRGEEVTENRAIELVSTGVQADGTILLCGLAYPHEVMQWEQSGSLAPAGLAFTSEQGYYVSRWYEELGEFAAVGMETAWNRQYTGLDDPELIPYLERAKRYVEAGGYLLSGAEIKVPLTEENTVIPKEMFEWALELESFQFQFVTPNDFIWVFSGWGLDVLADMDARIEYVDVTGNERVLDDTAIAFRTVGESRLPGSLSIYIPTTDANEATKNVYNLTERGSLTENGQYVVATDGYYYSIALLYGGAFVIAEDAVTGLVDTGEAPKLLEVRFPEGNVYTEYFDRSPEIHWKDLPIPRVDIYTDSEMLSEAVLVFAHEDDPSLQLQVGSGMTYDSIPNAVYALPKIEGTAGQPLKNGTYRLVSAYTYDRSYRYRTYSIQPTGNQELLPEALGNVTLVLDLPEDTKGPELLSIEVLTKEISTYGSLIYGYTAKDDVSGLGQGYGILQHVEDPTIQYIVEADYMWDWINEEYILAISNRYNVGMLFNGEYDLAELVLVDVAGNETKYDLETLRTFPEYDSVTHTGGRDLVPDENGGGDKDGNEGGSPGGDGNGSEGGSSGEAPGPGTPGGGIGPDEDKPLDTKVEDALREAEETGKGTVTEEVSAPASKPVKVEAGIFEKIRGKDVELAFQFETKGVQATLVFNGREITNAKAIDVGLTIGDTAKVASMVADDKALVIEFPANGELPGRATLVLATNDADGTVKNLYYMEGDKLVLEVSGLVAKGGYYEIPITHNSTFVLAAGLREGDRQTDDEQDGGKQNPNTGVVIACKK